MNILCNVDQREALRLGYNAPSSTVHIDVDPAQLTEQERDALAEIASDGHDATKRGLPVLPGRQTSRLTLINPTLDGLRSKLSELITERDRITAERRERANEEVKAVLGEDNPQRLYVSLGADGSAYTSAGKPDYRAVVTASIEVPSVPYVSDAEDADDNLVARYEAERESAQAARSLLIDEATQHLREGLYREYLAEQQRVRDEYDALYARLPETLRARHDDGFASDTEVKKELRKLIRRDAGYGGYDGWSDSLKLSTLSDAEYQRLTEIKAEAPEDAIVEPRELWDGHSGYRPAKDDEMDEADKDGEVWFDNRENFRRVAVIKWSRGGVETKAVEPLS